MNFKTKYLYLFFLLASIMAACGTPAQDAISTSTAVPDSTLATDSPIAVAQGFWDAIKAKDIDMAMVLVADDVETRGGPAYFSSKTQFSSFMSSELKKGNTFEITALKLASDDTVTYTMTVYTNGTVLIGSSGLRMQVKDGKIVLVEFPL